MKTFHILPRKYTYFSFCCLFSVMESQVHSENFSPVILNKELTFNCTPPWSFWYYGKKLCGTEEDSILWKILKHPRGIVGVKSFYRSQNPSCVLFLWNINDVESHRIMQSAALFLLNVTQEAKGQDKPC